jgi:superfamily I DNA and/or RNA helicase
VRCLRAALPQGTRIGTVDKSQGQEAPIVLFSMTSSTGEDVPRGMDFLFSKNRLNVAVSRAQCLAIIVTSASRIRGGSRRRSCSSCARRAPRRRGGPH